MANKKFQAPRKGSKIRTGGHTTHVEGLMGFLKQLEKWQEITQIRCGSTQQRHKASRASTQVSTKPTVLGQPTPGAKQPRKHAKGGGGFQFRATRWATIGEVRTGIKCDAVNGRSVQEVILMSDDLEGLRRRLVAEGICSRTW